MPINYFAAGFCVPTAFISFYWRAPVAGIVLCLVCILNLAIAGSHQK